VAPPGGERAPSMADVAAAAGVSVSTVSRALSGRGDLPARTRSRVQAIAQQLGYKRQASIGGRPTQDQADPRIIELVLGFFVGAWADEAIVGARAAASRLGYDLALTEERDEPSDDWPSRVAARRSSGVVLGIIRPTQKQLAALSPLETPVVLLDPSSEPLDTIRSVGTTDWQGGYDAGAHLAGCGLTRFIVVEGLPRYRFGRIREEGFRQAVEDLARDGHIETIGGQWTGEDLSGSLARALERLSGPVGIFASNDRLASSVYKAAAQLNLAIPENLSVVGFDDERWAATLSPPLTTVRPPIRAMASRAVQLVHELREGRGGSPVRVELPSHLVVRQSTRHS
jgi:LacI family transcriptional regulator